MNPRASPGPKFHSRPVNFNPNDLKLAPLLLEGEVVHRMRT